MDCCDQKYSHRFDQQQARIELADYRKNNIKKTTRPLLNALKKLSPVGASMLDIGGGIGVLDFELLKAGVAKAIHVELAEPFSKAFLQEAERQAVADKVHSYRGDFLQVHEKIERVDLVCLDKVICCYEQSAPLVAASLSKSQKWYAYVIPRDVWWVKLTQGLKDLFQRFMSDPFRTYVHPVAAIEQQVLQAGFRKIEEHRSIVWQTSIYEKI